MKIRQLFATLAVVVSFGYVQGLFAAEQAHGAAAEHIAAKPVPSDSHSKPAEPEKAASTAAVPSESEPAAEHTSPSAPLPPDVRVLIDVSGSMKQTDPQNLRKPAVDLIVRLLPDKSKAGLWTFGNDVNMLMPHHVVDGDWRKQAAPKSASINSVALFTNIGKALDAVAFDKTSPDPAFKKHIILLTDGVVDINKDPAVNTSERQRILTDILPQLKKAGYSIHTIALSKNADMDLLKKLSVNTDGLYTVAESAEQLMPVFLKLFDQAVPAERTPIENNAFLVDSSIKEFTALIFRKPGEEKTIIENPEGKGYNSTNPAEGINWYRTDSYDLITVQAPKAGKWRIKTEIAPQSRVTIVSDLQIALEPLKNNIHSNDVVNLRFSFQENGKTITDKAFLSVIDTTAIVAKEKSDEGLTTSLPATDAPPADGIFQMALNQFGEIGDYEIHLYVDGKTFRRELKYSLNVRDTYMSVKATQSTNSEGKIAYNYRITGDEKLVDLKKLQVTAVIRNSLNSGVNKSLAMVNDDHWEFSFTPVQEAEYTIDVKVAGALTDGSPLEEVVHADKFTFKNAKAEPEAKKEEHAPAEHEKAAEPEHKEESPAKTSSNLLLYAGIGLANLLLIVGGYFVYRTFFSKKAREEMDEFEKALSDTKPEKPTKKPDSNTEGKGKSETETPTKAASEAPSAPELSAFDEAEKTEIDLSDDDDSLHIPMSDDNSMDKLFPLDSMDDGEEKKD